MIKKIVKKPPLTQPLKGRTNENGNHVCRNQRGKAMLESIGESAVRMTTRMDSSHAVENRDVALQKAEKVVEERPIENADESTKPEADTEQKTSGYNSDENGIFFEKYDKQGNVILRVPPEEKPIDEHV